MTADLPAAMFSRTLVRSDSLARGASCLLGLSFFCWAHLTIGRQPFPGSPASHDVNVYATQLIALVSAAGGWLSGRRATSRTVVTGTIIWLGASLLARLAAPDPVLALTWTVGLGIALALLFVAGDRHAMATGMAVGAIASLPLMVFQAAAQTTWPAGTIQGWLGGEPSPAVRGAAVLGDERWLRPYGLMPHPNMAGGVAAVACALAASLWLREHHPWQLVAVGAGFADVLLSFSRSAWLGAVAGLFILAWPRRGHIRGLVVAVLAPALLFGATLGGLAVQRTSASGQLEDDSLSQRVFLVQTALQFWRQEPLLGIGPDQFSQAEVDLYGPSFTPEPAHNALLLILAETGAAGLLGCSLVVAGVVVRMAKRRDWDSAAAGVTVFFPLMLDHYLITTGIGLVVVTAVAGAVWPEA